MATASSNIVSKLRRAEPVVSELFRHCTFHRPSGTYANYFASNPQMVVLFTWLGAKERTAHKFVHAWNRRGFHVMNITTSVSDLLMPRTLAEPTASRIVDYLLKHDKYRVTIHGLSVGGYLGQRVLMTSQNTDIHDRVEHQIYDSFTNTIGLQGGVENATNPKYRKMATFIGRTYAKYADLSSFKETEKYIAESIPPSPVLFMHSMNDAVSSYKHVLPLVKGMACQNRHPVYTFLLPEENGIKHLTMFRHMGQQAYMKIIMDFFAKDSVLAANESRLYMNDVREQEEIEIPNFNTDISFSQFVN